MFKFDNLNKVFIEVVCFCLLFVLLIRVWCCYYLYYFNYFKRKGVPVPPRQFPAGNTTRTLLDKEVIPNTVENFQKEFKKEVYSPINVEIGKHYIDNRF
jgi:hypothetical protein